MTTLSISCVAWGISSRRDLTTLLDSPGSSPRRRGPGRGGSCRGPGRRRCAPPRSLSSDAVCCCCVLPLNLTRFTVAVPVCGTRTLFGFQPRPSGARARPRSLHFPEGQHGSILEGDCPSGKRPSTAYGLSRDLCPNALAAGVPCPQFFAVTRIPGGLLDEELRTWHPRRRGRSCLPTRLMPPPNLESANSPQTGRAMLRIFPRQVLRFMFRSRKNRAWQPSAVASATESRRRV